MRSQHGHPRSAVIFVLAISGLSALAGCYTVLKHPPTAEVVDGGEARRDCYDCHSETGPAHPYDPMTAPGFGYLDDEWYGWYAYPWWYRDYWYSDRYDHHAGHAGHAGGADVPTVPDRNDDRRHLWGRGVQYGPPAMPPILSQPGAGGGSGGTSPSSEKDQQKDSGRTMKSPPGNPGNQNQGDNNKDKNKDKDKDKDKDKKDRDKKDGRNLWKRGGGK